MQAQGPVTGWNMTGPLGSSLPMHDGVQPAYASTVQDQQALAAERTELKGGAQLHTPLARH
jgi:hypothetical protein